mmetsp:Transcript_12291/g.37046  ORF Transcript_12291/g.37046 Transcript_12291/m.37046 type:complete len:345 (-) Transcript_12291:872-1906(-)
MLTLCNAAGPPHRTHMGRCCFANLCSVPMMALAWSTISGSSCFAHLPTSLPIAVSCTASQVSGSLSRVWRFSRTRARSPPSRPWLMSCFMSRRRSFMSSVFLSLSFCDARAAWSFTSRLVGSSSSATFRTSSASCAAPASKSLAANCERPLTSTSLGIWPTLEACTAQRACRSLRLASRSPSSSAQAAWAQAHSQSSSGWSCLTSSSSTSKSDGTSPFEASATLATALACSGSSVGLPSAPSSSSSHSRSYMLSPTLALLPCSFHRRPSRSCSIHAMTRRQRLRACLLCLPSSRCCSSSARLRSSRRLSMPCQLLVVGPWSGGVTLSTSILMTTGPDVSGMVAM